MLIKLLSGRFIFTVITAFVFAYSVWKESLNNEQIVAIIMLIIGFYFNRTDRNQNGGAK